MVPVVTQYPTSSQGNNGDMLLYQSAGIATLLLKSRNMWGSIPLSFGSKKKQDLSHLSYSHDTGWFPVQSPSDSTQFPDVANSNGMTPGKYRIKHNSGTAFVKAELYCRFTALNNGNQEKYTINLTSHVSYLGPKSSSYGYFIRIIDNNTFDLHIHEHGLTMLYSELFDDGTYKDLIVTSKDAGGNQLTDVEFPAVEVRAFVYPIKKQTTEPTTNHVVPGPNTNHHLQGAPIDHGNKVIGDKQAAVNGTNSDTFIINAGGQGAAESPASYNTQLRSNAGNLVIEKNTGSSGASAYADFVGESTRVDTYQGRSAGNTINVGAGTGDTTVKSNGNNSLVLSTGNSSTGTMTITDGANEDILVTPNGSGNIKVGSTGADATIISNGNYGIVLSSGNASAGNRSLISISDGRDIQLTPKRAVTTTKPFSFNHYATPTPSDSADCDIDFNGNGNKARMTFTGADITVADARLIFPVTGSGNYTVLVKTHSSVTKNLITTWTSHYGAADTDPATVKWPGGSKPSVTQTADKMDVFCFYWDANEKIAYGVASQNFS